MNFNNFIVFYELETATLEFEVKIIASIHPIRVCEPWLSAQALSASLALLTQDTVLFLLDCTHTSWHKYMTSGIETLIQVNKLELLCSVIDVQ